MAVENLEEKDPGPGRERRAHAPLRPREAPDPFPMKPEHTNWRDEQRAWRTSATLFDQSLLMSDVYFAGSAPGGCSPSPA